MSHRVIAGLSRIYGRAVTLTAAARNMRQSDLRARHAPVQDVVRIKVVEYSGDEARAPLLSSPANKV
jgi:hypothetical protein